MSRDRALARIEDMREYGKVYPTPRSGAHTVWVLGHLAYIETLVVRHLMRGEPNSRYMHRGHLADARRAAGLERMWL
jgi:hypothetical protein